MAIFWSMGALTEMASSLPGHLKAISANVKRHQGHFQTLVMNFQLCIQTDAEKVEKATQCAPRV